MGDGNLSQSDPLLYVLILLAAMVVVVPVFQKFRSSPILGYLAAGMIIGPYGLALIGDTKAAHTLAHFGVVFLLFMIGLELSFKRLRTLGSKVFGLGSLQVGVTGVLIAVLAWGQGLGVEAAVIIGAGLALSSTAFVLQLLVERGERETKYGLTTFSILLLQDLAVVPILILVTLLGTEGGSFAATIGAAAWKGGLALLVVIVFGRFLLRPLYRVIAETRSSELFISTTLLMVLGMGWLMYSAGLSMELGALLAGLLLAETEYRHQIEADIKPFRGILLGLFFMTIGMGINILFIIDNLAIIALIVVGLLVGKTLITTILCRIVGIPAGSSIRTGLALSQGGEFGFVIFGAAVVLNLIADDVAQILLAVITLSMVATPTMFYLGKKIATYLQQQATDEQDLSNTELNEIHDHVIIAGFGRVGQTVARVLADAGIPYIALDLDQGRVAECRKQDMAVYYGDASQIHVLNAAGAGRANVAVITIDKANIANYAVMALRKSYPHLPIYVRARDRGHTKHLEEAGATAVVSEAAESSLQLGSIVLSALDICVDEIAEVIREYREDDYALLGEIISGKKKE